MTALAHHALVHGITDYTGVAELTWFRKILCFGWQCWPLGVPVRDGDNTLVALHIRIDEATITDLKRTGIYAPLS